MNSNNRISILPPEMRGVMHITGYRGQGKSFLAAQADLPDNIVFFDFEEKGEGLNVSGKGFGSYRSLTAEATDMKTGKPNMLALFDKTMEAITGLEQDRFSVVIFDNTAPMELAIKAEAVRNVDYYCQQFSLNKGNVLAGRYGGASAVVNFFISHMVNMLKAKGVKLVIVTTHIRPMWGAGGQIPNKYTIKGADRWQELSILTLILIPGINPPVPSALVQKEQLGQISLDLDLSNPEVLAAVMRGEEGHQVSRRLPYKLPEATFQKIRWYLSHPADINNPANGEMPKLEESDPFDEKLNKEQFHYAQLAMEQAKKEEDEAQADLMRIAQANVIAAKIRAQELFRSGVVAPPAIIEIIKADAQTGKIAVTDTSVITIPAVAAWISEVVVG